MALKLQRYCKDEEVGKWWSSMIQGDTITKYCGVTEKGRMIPDISKVQLCQYHLWGASEIESLSKATYLYQILSKFSDTHYLMYFCIFLGFLLGKWKRILEYAFILHLELLLLFEGTLYVSSKRT